MKQSDPLVIEAAAVRDATGVSASPAAVLLQDGRVVAAGDPASLPAELVAKADTIDRRDCLLMPAMVNAHTHLELTAIGPRPYDAEAGFVGWVKMLRSHWPEDPGVDVLPDDAWFVAGAQRGVAEALASGVQAVGDISRFERVEQVLGNSQLGGVSYHEMFGLGEPFDVAGLETIREHKGGLQPHAPYSAGRRLFEAAARSGQPIATHLAETHDEAEFVGALMGSKLALIRSVGKWRDSFAEHYGRGLSPVQWMRPHLEAAAGDGGWLVAHCNYVSDEDIAILGDTNTSVAYCPIASEYFGHKGHRYRDMLAAGVNVCLGTDSIVCALPDDPQPLGLLSAMRRLYERDKTDPLTLLRMATTAGVRALRLDEPVATLRPGAPANFACIPIDPASGRDPLEQVLATQAPAKALSLGGSH